MEREHRHLDREAEEHPHEDEVLRARDDPATSLRRQSRDVERLRIGEEEQGQEAQQHERRPEQGEQEELDRRVLAVRSAPDADHEEHRQQHELEEDEEEDEVLGHEGAVHARLEHEDEDEERLGVVRLGEVVPAVDDAQDHDEHREDQERQGDPVDGDVVVAVDHLDPLLVDVELQHLALVVVEAGQQVDADGERRQRRRQRGHLEGPLLRLRDGEHDHHPRGREEDRQGHSPRVEPVHVPLLLVGV